MPGSRLLLAFSLAAGCTEAPPELVNRCVSEALGAGEVYIGPISCRAMRFGSSGESRGQDTFLANSQLKAIVRHPQSSVTALGLGGGTLVDAAPWGFADRTHEVLPIVGGGWLKVDTFEVEADGVLVAGEIADLPDRPAERRGERAEVRWSLEPDSPWIHIDGADGLYLHNTGPFSLLDNQLVDSLTYGTDAPSIEDLGGAIRANGATRVLIARSREAGQWLYPDGIPVSGDAKAAEAVEVLVDDTVIGRLTLTTAGTFDTLVPSHATHLRSIAHTHAPSGPVAVGEDVSLTLGDPGSLSLSFIGSHDRPLAASWTSSNGRTGWTLLPPTGGRLDTGAGVVEVTLSGGPTIAEQKLRVDVLDATSLAVPVPTRLDPGQRVLALIETRADRSHSWRGTDEQVILEAAGRGVSWVLLAPTAEVPVANDPAGWAPWIYAEAGSRAEHSAGYSVIGWPFAARAADAAHGAVEAERFTPSDLVTAVNRGPRTNRMTIVDWPWILANETPVVALLPAPDFVRLPESAAGPSTWAPWFRFLDAGIPLLPLGPLSWVDVEDPSQLAEVDVVANLIDGRVQATTGPALSFQVGPNRPGDIVEGPGLRASIAVHGALEEVLLIVDGKVADRRDTVDGSVETFGVPAGRWAVAAGFSGEDWVVTGPVWLRAP